MTAIVAVTHEGRVYMGADALCCAGGRVDVDNQAKIWLSDDKVIGAAGSARACDVFRHGFKFPKQKRGVPDDVYMRFTVPAALREFLSTHLSNTSGEGGDDMGMTALIGWKGRLWQLNGDYCVLEIPDMDAIGSGGEVARAAIFGAKQVTHDLCPENLLLIGLMAAERLVVNVSGPFDYLTEPSP